MASCASCPVRLQDSLIINISGRHPAVFCVFWIGIVIKWRQHLKLSLLILGLVLFASLSIKLQDSLIINVSGRNSWICWTFCMEIIIKGRKHVSLPLLVKFVQLCFLSNQITGFFDHQYLCRESSDLSFFVWR